MVVDNNNNDKVVELLKKMDNILGQMTTQHRQQKERIHPMEQQHRQQNERMEQQRQQNEQMIFNENKNNYFNKINEINDVVEIEEEDDDDTYQQ